MTLLKHRALSTPTMGVGHNKLLDKIHGAEVPGTRHSEAIGIALGLLSEGWNAEQAFGIMRGKYSEDVTDKEIRDIVQWSENKATPNVNPSRSENYSLINPVPLERNVKPRIDTDRLLSVLSFNTFLQNDFMEASPVRLEDPERDQYLLVSSLYNPGELISLVPGYGMPEEVKTREDWLTYLKDSPAPCTSKGGFIRMNPIKEGHGSHIKDSDIASYRYLLIEADGELSLENQLSLLGTRIRSLAAITYSGGKSYHGWVYLNANSEEEYRNQARRVLDLLGPLGVDTANGNPSRMTRMPHVLRKDPEKGIEAWQKLIYLNPEPKPEFIFKGKEDLS